MVDFSQVISEFVQALYPTVIVLGLLGNMAAFLIFSRKRFRHTIFAVYFRVNLIVDSYVLANCVFDYLSAKFDIDLASGNETFCHFNFYSCYALAAMSAWLYVIESLYRMLDVIYPTQFQFRTSPKFQMSVCLILFSVCLLFYSPVYLEFSGFKFSNSSFNASSSSKSLNQTQNMSSLNDHMHLESTSYMTQTCAIFFATWFDIMDLLVCAVVPFLLMTFFIIVSLGFLYKRSQSEANHTKVTSKKLSHCKTNPDCRYGVIVVTLDVTFLALNLPDRVVNFFRPDTIPLALWQLVRLIWYMNYGTIFYLNLCVNRIFKAELIAILKSWQKKWLT